MDLFDSSSGFYPSGIRRALKPLVVAASLFVTLFLTLSRRGPEGQLALGPEPLRAAQKDKRPYDLTALKIFNKSLMRVNDSYVDPTRVDPKQMLLAALDQVQKSVAEVLVEPRPDKSKVMVRVDTAEQTFAIADVDSPWALSPQDARDLPLHRAEPRARHRARDRPQHRVRGGQRHAVDARSALDAARPDDVPAR